MKAEDLRISSDIREAVVQLLLDFNLLRRAYLRKFFPRGAGVDSEINFVDFSILTLIRAGQFRSTTLAAGEIGISQSFCSRAVMTLENRALLKKNGAATRYELTRNGEDRLLRAIDNNSTGYAQLLRNNLSKRSANDLVRCFRDLALSSDAHLEDILEHFEAERQAEIVLNSVSRKLNNFGNYALGTNLTFLEVQLLNSLTHSLCEAFPLNKVSQILACRPAAAVSAVNKLKKQGLLNTSSSFVDKKSVFLSISSRGRTAYKSALKSGARLLSDHAKVNSRFAERAGPAIRQLRDILPQQIVGTDPFILQGGVSGKGRRHRFVLMPEYLIWPGLSAEFTAQCDLEIFEQEQKLKIAGSFARAKIIEVQKILRAFM